MKIHGIGVDILKMDRIKTVCDDPDDPFMRKTFTAQEIIMAGSHENPMVFFATRFSAKEAVFKALQLNANQARFNEIEILKSGDEVPYVILHGRLKQYAQEHSIEEIKLSLSYDSDCATAFAVALSEERGKWYELYRSIFGKG